jgi:hypothetical protein
VHFLRVISLFGMLLVLSMVIKTIFMSSILYLIAVVLIIGWILGFFVFSAGSIIHVLLVLAVIAILIRLIGGSRNPV